MLGFFPTVCVVSRKGYTETLSLVFTCHPRMQWATFTILGDRFPNADEVQSWNNFLIAFMQIKTIITLPRFSMCSHTELRYRKTWTNMSRKKWSPEQCPGIVSSGPVWRWSWCRPWSTLPDFPTPECEGLTECFPQTQVQHSCFYFPNNENSRNTSVFMLCCWQFTKKYASNSFYPNRQRHVGSKTQRGYMMFWF